MPCFCKPLDRGLQLAARRMGEVGEEQVADLRSHHEGVPDGVGRDLRPRDRHAERLVDPGPPDRDRDLAALGTAELPDDVVGRHVFLDFLVPMCVMMSPARMPSL